MRPHSLVWLLVLLWLAAPAFAAPHDDGEALMKRGAALGADGQFIEAEATLKRALAIFEIEKSDGYIGLTLRSLGQIYYAQDRNTDAEAAFQRALPLVSKLLGPEHASTISIVEQLGVTKSILGRADEAERLLRRALAYREATAGPEHPHIASLLSWIAETLMDRLNYVDAEPLLSRALAIREKMLKPGDPLLASVRDKLGLTYLNLNMPALAVPLFERALADLEKVAGPVAAETGGALVHLGLAWHQLSRYRDAEGVLRRGLTIREAVRPPQDAELAEALEALAGTLIETGKLGEAEILQGRALAMRERQPDLQISRSLINLGIIYRKQARYDAAEASFKRALTVIEKRLGPDHNAVGLVLRELGSVYLSTGRKGEAEGLYGRALVLFEKSLGPDHPAVANAAQSLASVLVLTGRLDRAENLLKRALAIYEKSLGQDNPQVGAALNDLARVFVIRGHEEAARPLFARAYEILKQAYGPDHLSVATIGKNTAGRTKNRGEANQDALVLMAAAIREEEVLGRIHPRVARTYSLVADLFWQLGVDDVTRSYSQDSVDILGTWLARQPAGAMRRELLDGNDAREIVALRVFFAEQRLASSAEPPEAEIDAALRAIQLLQSGSADQAIAGMAARFAAGSDRLATIVRQRQDAAAQRRQLDEALLELRLGSTAKRDPKVDAKLQADLDGVDARLRGLDDQIARDFPAYRELTNPAPLGLAALRALLRSDEAVLIYMLGALRSHLLVVRPDAAGLFPIARDREALADAIAGLRADLDPAWNPSLKPFDIVKSHALYGDILAPAAPLLEGVRHLLVVPDGALQSLPLGVLVTEPSSDPKNFRVARWLLRTHAVTTLPSVASLRALRRPGGNMRPSAPFVGIGDPTLEGQPGQLRGAAVDSLFVRGVGDVEMVRKLVPLPETAGELKALAKALGAGEDTVYLRARATETALKRMDLTRYRVIAFATHGVVAGEIKNLAEPALVLTPPAKGSAQDDGLLTASEIAQLKLNADWVILSACNTAASDGKPGAEGLSGLARAFFYAGSRALMVSHWPVHSEAATRLTTGALNALKTTPDIGRAEALRRSQLAMLDDKNLAAEFGHPMLWAPFVIVGEGGAPPK